MNSPTANSTIGVLASGGLDSCILVAHLLRQGCYVRPIHVRCGLIWENEELAGLRAFLRAISSPELDELVSLNLPLEDLYGRHWSIDGRNSPDADTSADAVYLPGRNALLIIKPAIWCGLHGISRMALATLAGNPFGDATNDFFQAMESTLELATGNRVTIVRPFEKMDKCEVVRLGKSLPIELTFSCLAPSGGLHCGRCNKCAERQNAFQTLNIPDPTQYANYPNHPRIPQISTVDH